MFFNRFTAIICGIVISVAATAQVKLDKLKFGDIKAEDFKSDHYAIQLRTRLKLNKANFAPQDYETLRNFFAFVVQKQAEQIVFKKI